MMIDAKVVGFAPPSLALPLKGGGKWRIGPPPPWAYSAEVAFGYEGWKGEVETAGNRPGVEGGGGS